MEDFFDIPENEQETDLQGKDKGDRSKLKVIVMAYVFDHYEPAENLRQCELHFSTRELWEKLQQVFCDTEMFCPSDVATWLVEYGFICGDFGEMQYEWLLKKKAA